MCERYDFQTAPFRCKLLNLVTPSESTIQVDYHRESRSTPHATVNRWSSQWEIVR